MLLKYTHSDGKRKVYDISLRTLGLYFLLLNIIQMSFEKANI